MSRFLLKHITCLYGTFNGGSRLQHVMSLSPVEAAKSAAALQAVKENVFDGCRLGVGSGSTVVFAVQHLANLVKTSGITVTCVPTSFQAKQLILENQLELSDLSRCPVLDVVIDGADECDTLLTLIKGGGGCHLQEKIVASCSRKMVVIADYRKKSQNLGDQWRKGIPIEVVPMAYVPVSRKLVEYNLEPVLRMAKAKAGPVVTDNGNFVIDAMFSGPHSWKELDVKLNTTPGIVETGLFVGFAKAAYFGMEDGSVSVVHA